MSSINLLSGGLDVQGTVEKLIYVESEPIRRLETQTKTLNSKVSAYQSLNTKVSALLDQVNEMIFQDETASLAPVYSFEDRLAHSVFGARQVTSSDDDAVSATATKGMSTGTFALAVTGLAQARTVAAGNFADTTTTRTGTGTLAFRVGSAEPVTVTIDSTNNTLEGVRRAINAANAGVTATIVNDGSSTPYRLTITANETGTANSFSITDNLTGGQALNLAEKMAAQDAEFSVNGVNITKASNTVSDVVDGVTFTLKNTTATPVMLTVQKDYDAIVSAVQKLATAFNEVNTFANQQFRYNQTTKTAGVLSGDATLRSTQTRIRDILAQAVGNAFTPYRTISQIGISFSNDGSLVVDDTKLRKALTSNSTQVAALLLGDGAAGTAESFAATDARVSYYGKAAATQTGTYDVSVTALAAQAAVTGSDIVTALAQDEQLTIRHGGTTTLIDLLFGDSLATVLSKVNQGLVAAGVAATASDDGTGRIRITTSGWGSGESISVESNVDATGSSGFGTTAATATGTDIEGTINGHTAAGAGLVLTGAAGQPEEGLGIAINQESTGDYGSVSFTQAVSGSEGASILVNLRTALKAITDPLSGPIQRATDALHQTIKSIADRIEEYEERMEVREELLTAEYSRADQALRLMTVTQSALSSQISSFSS